MREIMLPLRFEEGQGSRRDGRAREVEALQGSAVLRDGDNIVVVEVPAPAQREAPEVRHTLCQRAEACCSGSGGGGGGGGSLVFRRTGAAAVSFFSSSFFFWLVDDVISFLLAARSFSHLRPLVPRTWSRMRVLSRGRTRGRGCAASAATDDEDDEEEEE